MFDKNSYVYIAGHTGLLGSAILKTLQNRGFKNLITKTHKELDLTKQNDVDKFFENQKIDYIFVCAGKVGGIMGNKTYPADYLSINSLIQNNIFEMSVKYDVKNVVFYGSSCTYPKICKQPMKEEYWLTGAIEESSMGYAAAKISTVLGCKSYNTQYKNNRFICLIPNSIYGENDNFDLENSHVFSALIRKIYEAHIENKDSITLWGSGIPKREFIYSFDVADASIFAIENIDKLENTHYNVGSGTDYSIKELAEIISKEIGYKGEISWDISKPDGTPQKLLDSSKFLALGWEQKTTFQDGLKKTINWYKNLEGNKCL